MSRPVTTHSTLSHVTETSEKTTQSNTPRLATPSHKTWTAFTGPVLYTGPGGLRNQRVSTQGGFQQVGENEKSEEVTSHISYLNRAAPGEAFPKAKHGQVGEIGWVYDTLHLVNGL